MARAKNLAGMVFGRLTALREHGRNKHGLAVWECACDCGNTHFVVGTNLTRGHVTSCGKHGHRMSGTPIYRVWASMRRRCEDPAVKAYPAYGGRGIKVCDRWQSFEHFYADMGERPSPAHSLERLDNDGDYCPENCVWATREVQVRNKRSTRLIMANGETLHLAEWARRLGCGPAAILSRIGSGMSEADAVTKPVPERPNSRLTAEDACEIRALYPGVPSTKLAERFGVSKKTILNVLHRKTFADV